MSVGEYIALGALIISLLAFIASIFNKKEGNTEKNASILTTLTVQYETIKDLIKDMGADIKSVKTDVDDLKIKVAGYDQSFKAIWRQIEDFKHTNDDGK